MSDGDEHGDRRAGGPDDDSDEVLAELVRVLVAPGGIHPGLAAQVVEQATALREPAAERLRGTAFDGRLFAAEGVTAPLVRRGVLV